MASSSVGGMSIFRALLLAFAQLGDPRLRAPLVKSLVLTIASFVAIWIAMGWVVTHTKLFETLWLDWTIDALGGLALAVLSFVLFPAVVVAFVGLFLDEVADAVQARHYPAAPPPRRRPLMVEIFSSLQLVTLAVVLNLLVLPLYFVPGLNLVIFLATNGFLLAREYVTMLAARRLDSHEARRLWKSRRGQAWFAGISFAALSAIPVVNLAVPVLAVAATAHLVESWLPASGE